jgi:cytolysin-activating lysine-acyltransferase
MGDFFEQLGLVTALWSQASSHRHMKVGKLTQSVETAIHHGHIGFAFDNEGAPLAYWTWALLSDDVVARLLDNPRTVLHESEWTEGERLWIMDFVAPRGHVRDVVRHIRATMGPRYGTAGSLRKNQDGKVRKTSCWRYDGSSHEGRRNPLIYTLPEQAFAASRAAWRAAR